MEITRKAGDATRGPADRFARDVWIWPRIGATGHTEVRVVLFTPGARTVPVPHAGGGRDRVAGPDLHTHAAT